MWFLSSVSFLAVITLAINLSHVTNTQESIDFDNDVIPSCIIMIFTFLALVLILGLYAFHIYLVLINMTTNEKIKDVFTKKYLNPFYRGSVSRNLWFWITKKRGVSQYDLRKVINPLQENRNPNELFRGIRITKEYRDESLEAHQFKATTPVIGIHISAATSRHNSVIKSDL